MIDMDSPVTLDKASAGFQQERRSLYRLAGLLAVVTIFYNIVEGVVSVYFGLQDETVALFGFGLDSFVEVVSGLGVWHMIRRIGRDGTAGADRFECRALRITGTAFYVLSAGLLATAALNISRGHTPETTFWGIVVSLVSIFTMWVLIHFKVKTGKKLGSNAILADAECTRACLYLSVVLLISSGGYELFGVGGLDSAGAVAIALLSLKEGREAMQKAKTGGT